ncbi:MAG: aminotransferase class III-fold pyridoxal phosphate-dependent enzyme, partial [Mesorhizobium sp.]
IADESNRIGTFGHGFTGGGHPVAAAVAFENLKLIEERDLVGNARSVGAHMQKRLRSLASHPLVGEVRGVGLIAAVELVGDKANKTPWETAGALGGLVNGFMQQNGVISRNMGDALAFCPPLIITEPQVDQMIDAFERSLEAAVKQVP